MGRFLEARAGNVIWDRHLLIKCPCSGHRMQPLIKKKSTQPEQLGYMSHVKGIIMFLTDYNYMPPS